jgi:hypothetical protein
MKKFVLSTLLGMMFFFVSAQDESVKRLRDEAAKEAKKDAADTTTKTWKRGGIYGLNISQGSLTNWAAGGEDFSLSINSLLNLYAFYKKTKHSWDNTFDFNLGYVNTTSLGGRKNDDRFDLLSKYGYALGPKLNLAGIFNFRSQLFRGYTFEDNIKTYSSNFLAPGYLLLGAGLDYKPVKDLSIFLSPATARWIIVRDTALSNKGLYGVDPGETSALEFGAFATINYLKDISKSVTYKGRLDLFSNYLHNPQNIDVYMTNAINVKLSRVLALTWGLDLIYDDDVKLFGPNRNSAAWQIKSLVGIGLLVKFD